MRQLLNLFSSMNVGILLLVAVGIASAIGSYKAGDPKTAEGFFSAPFFFTLLVLLLMNMTLCSARKLNGFAKGLRGRKNGSKLLRRSGILGIHIGVVLILVGGVINGFAGVATQVPIVEGESLPI